MFEKFMGMLAGAAGRRPQGQLEELNAELAQGWSYSAYDRLRILAEEGNPAAQFRLGQVYERAEGVVQNLADAVHWFVLAANQGFAPAQARLGLIYFIDPPEAASLVAEELEQVEIGVSSSFDASASMLKKSFPNGFSVSKDYAEAARWNLLAAEQGVPEAQARYGEQLARGLGVNKDLSQAERWFSLAATQGDQAGQIGLGVLYAGGFGDQADFPRAFEWLSNVADSDSSVCHYWLGAVLLRRDFDRCDANLGVQHLERAVELNNSDAMYLLGLTLWQGDQAVNGQGEFDPARAESLLRRAANRGHVDAAYALGNLLLEVNADEGIEASTWLRAAAEKGHKRAAAVLGELYLSDKGLPIDPEEAGRWLTVGDTECNPDAFTSLASFYVEGRGVEKDYTRAAHWLKIAAERGSAAAHFNLGSLYRYGLGLPEDRAEAARFYRLASDRGNKEAAFHLGLLYSDPDTEFHDEAAAADWFSKAADEGDALARYNFALLLIEGKGVEADPVRAAEILEILVRKDEMVLAAETLVELYSGGKHLPPSDDLYARALVNALRLGSDSIPAVILDFLQQGKHLAVNPEIDLARYKQAAGDGAVSCQVALGRLYAAGIEGAPDFEAAYSWLELAADSGDAFAQAWMGDCCRLGLVDPPDAASAEWWYRKAASQNHPGALMLLAEALDVSEPNARENLEEIFGLLIAAASNGSMVAQRKVGACYLLGRGCAQDSTAAAEWFLSAAEQGDAEAEYELGVCYSEGRGVEQDLDEAQNWLARASQHGFPVPAVSNS